MIIEFKLILVRGQLQGMLNTVCYGIFIMLIELREEKNMQVTVAR
jgi:hypothetical protein